MACVVVVAFVVECVVVVVVYVECDAVVVVVVVMVDVGSSVEWNFALVVRSVVVVVDCVL